MAEKVNAGFSKVGHLAKNQTDGKKAPKESADEQSE